MRVKYDFNSNAWTIPILAMLFVNSPTHMMIQMCYAFIT